MNMTLPAFVLLTVFTLQAEMLTGRVITRTGDPVPGIFVTLVGTSLKDTTDENGEYSLDQSAAIVEHSISGVSTPFTISARSSELVLEYGPRVRNVDVSLLTVNGRRIGGFSSVSRHEPAHTVEMPLQGLAAGMFLLEQRIDGTLHRTPLWYTDNSVFQSQSGARKKAVGPSHTTTSARGTEQDELLNFYTDNQNIAVAPVRDGGVQIDLLLTTVTINGSPEEAPTPGQTVVADVIGETVSESFPIRRELTCTPEGDCSGEIFLRYHPFKKRHEVSVAVLSLDGDLEGRSEITAFSSSDASVITPSFQNDNKGYIRPTISAPDTGFTVGTVLTWNTSPGKDLYAPPKYSVQVRTFDESVPFTETAPVHEGIFLLERPDAETDDLEIRVVVQDTDGTVLGVSDSIRLPLTEPEETIHVLHPRAGDVFSVGETLDVIWWASSSVTAVEIHFDSEAGLDFEDIAGETIKPHQEEWGRLRWKIEKEYGLAERSPVSDKCVIKVFPYDQGVSSAFSGIFEIKE